MEIRKLEGKERYEAYLMAVYCFHMRVDDVEAEREKYEADTKEDWGAFDEDGTLMARIINYKYDLYLDGNPVRTGGIGAVSTLPEYRNRGAIKEIFHKLLPAAYKDGEVLSLLYPFKHEFYRKQGYEVLTAWNEYTLTPGMLCQYGFGGEVKKWNMGDPVTDFMTVYDAFAPQFNLALARTKEDMSKHLKVNKPYVDRQFSYILKKNEQPVAYVIFTDIRHDPAAILQVEECAWTGRDGFYAILGFLARFESDYGTIKLSLPKGIDLLRIVKSPMAYDIQKTPQQGLMVRVINAKKLLETVKKPVDCDFTMQISDEIIKENNQVLRVKGDCVEVLRSSLLQEENDLLTSDMTSGADRGSDQISNTVTPDIIMNVRTLGQLAVGCLNLDEAMLREDVIVNAKEEMLRCVFTEKKVFLGEHF